MFETIHAIPAIDLHSHFGPYCCPKGTYHDEPIQSNSLQALQRTMRLANIAISINSTLYALMPRGCGDVIRGNEILMEVLNAKPEYPGVYGWAVVNPLLPESFAQAAELLKNPKVMGIKVHPEEHLYPILRYGDEIYRFAAEQKAVIITHSGEQNSMPEDFCRFANAYPGVKTIVSHMGCGYDGNYDHQLRAIESNTEDNLFTDTSSARSMASYLLEYAVNRIGSEKILFGTDNGCYFAPSQRIRVDDADISNEAKENILYRNALRLFPVLREIYKKETQRQK